MGQVTFHLDAEMAGAVQGFLKVVDVQRKTEQGFKRTVQHGRLLDQTAKSLGSSLKSMALGIAGAFGASAMISQYADRLRVARETTLSFEKEMTGLLSLGDNLKNRMQVKGDVLGLSAAMGMDRKEIADTMFQIQSGASHFSKALRDELLVNAVELTKVTGAELPDSLQVLLKTMLIYGDSLKGVNDAQNKLFKTAELGYMTFQDLSQLLPDVIAPAKALGYSLDDVLASLIVATQLGGKNEKTFTGIRNVFMRMGEAAAMGAVKSRDFLGQLQELSKVNPDVIKKIFGVEAMGVAANLAASAARVNEQAQIMRRTSGDIARAKLLERMQDPAYRYAEMNRSIEQTKANYPLSRDYASKWGRQEQELELRKLGAREMMGPLVPKKLRDLSAWANTANREFDRWMANTPWVRRFMTRKRIHRVETRDDQLLVRGRNIWADQQERGGRQDLINLQNLEASGGQGKVDQYLDRLIAALERNTTAVDAAGRKMSPGINPNMGIP